jgi:hypothetical protein
MRPMLAVRSVTEITPRQAAGHQIGGFRLIDGEQGTQ